MTLAKEDFAFHWTLAEISGNQIFCEILSRCVSLVPLSMGPGKSQIIAEHSAIVEAATMGRADAAALYRHVMGAAQRGGSTLPETGLNQSAPPAR